MSLRVERVGNFLFRWRGYLPLILFFLFWKLFLLPEYVELYLGEFGGDLYELFCITISMTGLLIRLVIGGQVPEGTSGRNTKEQKANFLNTTGFYSIVRHPIYILGNFPIFLGILLFIQIWWIVVAGVIIFWIYYLPIMKAEDKFLERKFGEDWRKWAAKTPLLIPNLKNWQPSLTNFSWKKAIKKEYTTLFVILATYSLIDIIRDLFTEKKIDFFWGVILILNVCFYFILKFLKKKTKLFKSI